MADLFRPLLTVCAVAMLLASATEAAEIFHDWNVSLDWTSNPVATSQPVITINGMFPGPLINSTTNDLVFVNVFNNLDEPLLMTWNGIQQRLNSWQDGVSGTNCPIEPGKNWTYAFQVKDQIGSFFYFPSINFQKAAGGYGPIRVNNRNVILVPFDRPAAEFDLLIGDWSPSSYKDARAAAGDRENELPLPTHMLINGKPAYEEGGKYESLEVEPGNTYRLRISNVGTAFSFNFRIQDHKMVLVETEGSYTSQMELDSLDVHVGQSYSVLFTANQRASDYFVAATPTQADTSSVPTLNGVAVLHYRGVNARGMDASDLPPAPAQLDREFSVNQARSIRWNMTTGAARPNPQGTFNVTKVAIWKTFVLRSSSAVMNGSRRFAVNNVSYLTPSTPLKLADLLANGTGVYRLDSFSVSSSEEEAVSGTNVASGMHKGWVEMVFQNDLGFMDAWHLDGFGFYTVGYGDGEWSPASRETYNLFDPVVRSTVQVYPGGWSAVYAFLDNPGMWNLRSQRLQNWFLGEELYVRVFDPNPNPAKERPPPDNLLRCGLFSATTWTAGAHS